MSIGTQIGLPRPRELAPAEAVLRIAVVGCGPRGLYCLERILHVLSTVNSGVNLKIDIYEPAPFPGAGSVYDPRQPRHLRMNFANCQIDARHPELRSAPCAGNCTISNSFVAWARGIGLESTDPNGYAPRSVVGEYLSDCFSEVLGKLRRVAGVTIHHTKATDIQRKGTEWLVVSESGQDLFDEVVLTVGHEEWRSAETYRTGEIMADIPAVFPVNLSLTEKAVPSGSTVAVRGFGLTWIDAALSMTEGRGGEFVCSNGQWTYRKSGREPRQMLPFSRSGRPYLAKPIPNERDADLKQIMSEPAETLNALRENSERSKRTINFREQVWPLVVEAAEHALHTVDNSHEHRGVRDWFRGWCRWRISGAKVVELQRRSYAVAMGLQAPDEAWALGHAWRLLYPAVVRVVSHGGLSEESRPYFRRIAAELERISFGPPAENLGRILALVDGALIDYGYLVGWEPQRHQHRLLLVPDFGEAFQIDKLIDATIPAPSQIRHAGMLDRLANNLSVEARPSGLRFGNGGRVIREDTSVVEGVAVFGRVSERDVLGNDTLSRTLHAEMDQWTMRLGERLRSVNAPHADSRHILQGF